MRNGSAPGNEDSGTEPRPTSTRLAHIHVGYEDQPEYPSAGLKTPEMPLDQRVGRLPFSNYRTQLRCHNFLTLDGIPAEAFNYRLVNRAALACSLPGTG